MLYHLTSFILVLKKATDEIAEVPEPDGSKQSKETFPLNLASTSLMHLLTGELSPSFEDYLTISQYDVLHLHSDL